MSSDNPFVSLGQLASPLGHTEDDEMREYMSQCAAVLVGWAHATKEDCVRIHVTNLKLAGHHVGDWLITIERTDSDVVN